MSDSSYLDKKYFIDNTVYNCPFCNRNNVPYTIIHYRYFNWTEEKICYVLFVKCDYCTKISMHSTFFNICTIVSGRNYWEITNEYLEDIDSKIFHSQPTSFFTIDQRIPRVIRELINEAEGCLKMNFLTGASACMRKAIYELLVKEGAEGSDYQAKIKSLKVKYNSIDTEFFDILAHIQDMTSDKIHEQSWSKWDSNNLILIIETLKSILYEICVYPIEKSERSSSIQKLKQKILEDKKKILK